MFQPLAERLRTATRALHTQVERSPAMLRLMRGEMSRAAYCALLRDLQAVYAALEDGLAEHAALPGLQPLADVALRRGPSLALDLDTLHGPGWPAGLAVSTPADDYARHLHRLARHDPALLAAHAYVRYLGDLAGGQMLARVVSRSLGLPAGEGVAFYDFGGAARVAELAARFRAGLDRIATTEIQAQALEAEACDAFRRHGDWFAAHA